MSADDAPDPAEYREWDADEADAWNADADERLSAALDDHEDLTADEQRARDALVAAASEQVDTETINLHEQFDISQEITIDVRTTLPGEVVEGLESLSPDDPASEAVPVLLDALVAVVESPDEYATRRVWRDVYRDSGIDVFVDYAGALLTPAKESLEAVDGFRDDGPRAGGP